MIQFEGTAIDSANNLCGTQDGSWWNVYQNGCEIPYADKEFCTLVCRFIVCDYQRFTMHLEDCIFVSPSPNEIVLFNCVSGQIWRSTVSCEQLLALLALAIRGEELSNKESAELYAVAESVLATCPPECRPIP